MSPFKLQTHDLRERKVAHELFFREKTHVKSFIQSSNHNSLCMINLLTFMIITLKSISMIFFVFGNACVLYIMGMKWYQNYIKA